jgi:hypothetical protein
MSIDYLDQKADALQKWSALLASIVEPKTCAEQRNGAAAGVK